MDPLSDKIHYLTDNKRKFIINIITLKNKRIKNLNIPKNLESDVEINYIRN